MNRWCRIFIGFLLLILVEFQQGMAQSYNFINYGIDEGLAHEKISDIAQDNFGNLWIATLGGGLSKFDGLKFTNFSISDGLRSNYIRDVLCSANGDVWVGTASGITKFDGREFEHYILDSVNLLNNSINVIFEDKTGDIWFSAPEGGLGLIKSKTKEIDFKVIPNWTKNDRIIAINQDNNGAIYFVSSIRGLFRYENGQAIEVISNANFKGFLLSLDIDQSNTFWVGTNRGLLRYDSKSSSSSYEMVGFLEGTFIRSSEMDNNGEGWVVSAFGLLKVGKDNLTSFNADEGFTNIGVNCLFEDREGNIWIGTDGEGIYKLTNDVFLKLNSKQGLSDYVISSITKDSRDSHWFGTLGGGVYNYVDNQIFNYTTKNGLANMYISASCKDINGNIWFGTRGSGLIKYDGKKFTQIDSNQGLIYDIVRCLYADSEGKLWIGTANGLSVYDGHQFINFTEKDGLADKLIWGISQLEDSRIMVVTRNGFNYFEKNNTITEFKKDELFNNRLNTAIQDKTGNIWIGYSGHGIKWIKPDGSELLITTENGLTSNLIYHLLFDKDKNVVVGSERGVDKIYLKNGEVDRIKNYGKVEGFDGIRTSPGSVYEDDDGIIWFGTSKNVFGYQGQNEKINEIEPITYIAGLKLFYNDIDWSDYADDVSKWSNVPQNLELSHDENSLVIEYFGNSLVNPQEVKYKFRLLGLRSDWSPVTTGTEAVYTNLPTGDYTFEVIAANSDNVWNTKPTQFKFSIVPPFWQSIWFYAVIVGLLVMAFKLYNDHRIQANLDKILTVERIRSEELVKVRKRMARDFHDNMGNQLASITVFTNIISLKLKDKSQEIDDLLKNIEKHTKSLFNGTKDFIWSIDPESDNLTEVFTYIKDFGEELFENTNISFFANNNCSKQDDVPLSSGWSRQVVLIFKEAMTNALKHSGGDSVYFELNLIESGFVIRLWDNGKGVVVDNFKKGNGFKNMRSRASQIGCELDIVSQTDNIGVLIQFKGHLQSELNNEGLILNKTTFL